MSSPSELVTLEHMPTYGAWAEENYARPAQKSYFYRIRSAHDCSGAGPFTKNGGKPRTTAFETFSKTQEDADWEPFDLHLQSPGFVIFSYSTAYCVWFFIAINAIERSVDFSRLAFDCRIDATAEFFVRRVAGVAEVELAPGAQIPSADDQEYILDRGAKCPVARNIGGSFEKQLTATYKTHEGGS